MDFRFRTLDTSACFTSEFGFCVSTWARSNLETFENYIGGREPGTYSLIIKAAESGLRRGNAMLCEAFFVDEPEPCFVGFACQNGGSLEYVYVKNIYRRRGLAKELIKRLPHPIKTYRFATHKNDGFMAWLGEQGWVQKTW